MLCWSTPCRDMAESYHYHYAVLFVIRSIATKVLSVNEIFHHSWTCWMRISEEKDGFI